ncbi:MAG: rRNA maturation RNase YbeY [Thermomicrobiales bacterium]
MDAPFTCTSEPVDLTEELDDSLLDELAELCCFALESEGATGAWEVSIVLTSDEHLTRLHDDFMGIPEPTDIMTFPSDDVPGGDVVISVAQADRQRHDDAWDLPSELRFLVTHGALHLADWDDATVDDRARMLDRQRAILAAFQSRDSSSNR